QIHEALRMVRQGTYGICGRCDGRVSSRRLQAQPFATLCIECKKQEEVARPSSPPQRHGVTGIPGDHRSGGA
ncbi:MAG: TraR/DksA C4-type zinc finger protein, partial [Candidatus Brocadiia bacterium]|nr:TraR/DksA C4-type zinc finger protein [Candidatus Brocadiia bacterium]